MEFEQIIGIIFVILSIIGIIDWIKTPARKRELVMILIFLTGLIVGSLLSLDMFPNF